MSRLEDYGGRFINIEFEQRDGVLQVRLHTNGGPFKRRMVDELGYGLALEGLAGVAVQSGKT
ncbi:hypothetical protein M3I54_26605 [Paraburkholderia sp. CNPSo 3274]|uniref:hypothetical protein n=1 Tax=Paraburkholderia sp. CNPSo 3274 TaxID=2940932 RepID=UPI0020B8A113|nr:hypothetical protein [Paraburkholderia sp. CNPSo 3274]MCP3710499.1 hypothetical protein [Paraburkholderia sp. CNPSo 3274]